MIRQYFVIFSLLVLFNMAMPASKATATTQNFVENQYKSALLLRINSDATTGAQGFIDKMAQNAIGFLKDDSLSQDAKAEKFRKLLHSNFDMKTIARFSLGKYWRTATKEEQTEYLKLFEDMIVEVYTRRFNDYQGQAFEIRDARMESDADTIVTSFIVPDSGPEVKVDWRVRNKNGSYKVVDVIVEGVSMGLTQRSDFSSVIQRGGGQVDVLLAHLRQN